MLKQFWWRWGEGRQEEFLLRMRKRSDDNIPLNYPHLAKSQIGLDPVGPCMKRGPGSVRCGFSVSELSQSDGRPVAEFTFCGSVRYLLATDDSVFSPETPATDAKS